MGSIHGKKCQKISWHWHFKLDLKIKQFLGIYSIICRYLFILVQGGTPPGMVREALGCVRRGGLSSPAYNHSTGYTCPQGRLLAQNTSHVSKGIVFEQVSAW